MSNTPLGAEYDRRAPYNQVVLTERQFFVDVDTTLTKRNVPVLSSYYTVHFDENGFEIMPPNDCDLRRAWEEQHYSVIDLLFELSRFVQERIERGETHTTQGVSLAKILLECQWWITTDETVELHE